MSMKHNLTPRQAKVLLPNQETEVVNFTITRAGLYGLAKKAFEFAKVNSRNSSIENITVFDVLNTLKSQMPLGYMSNDYNRIVRSIVDSIFRRFDEYFVYHRWVCLEISFPDIVEAEDDCNYHFIEDTIVPFYNHRYTRNIRHALHRCEECSNLFFEQNELDEDLVGRIPSRFLGIDGRCEDCYDSDAYIRCDDCGRYLDRWSNRYENVDGDFICRDCLENGDYAQCDYCGRWFRTDDGVNTEDNWYCSESCAESDGWHWSDYYDEWRQGDENEEVDEIITDYHSHEYYPVGTRKKGQKHDLLNGVEIEVDGLNRYDFSYDYFDTLNTQLKHCFFETDGSLDRGFEIISHPLTEEVFNKADWKTPFNKLIDSGWKSHDTTTCGLHFHFSDWYLGYTKKQKRDSAKKVCRFFQIYADELTKIARRNFQHYTMDLRNFGEDITKDTSFRKLAGDRYWAVNLTNMRYSDCDGDGKSTIEIRICRGTLKAETMLASHDFFLHIVRNAKKVPWSKITDLKLWFKGIKDQNTIDYIKSRHAFEGAF